MRKERVQSRGSLFLVLLQFTLAKTCPGLRRRSLDSSELKEAAGCLWLHAERAAASTAKMWFSRRSRQMGTCEGGHTQLLLQETPAPTVPVLRIPLLAQPWVQGLCHCHAGAVSLAWGGPLWRSGSRCLGTATVESCLAGSCVSVLGQLEVKLVPIHLHGRKNVGNAVLWSSPKLRAWEGTFPHC